MNCGLWWGITDLCKNAFTLQRAKVANYLGVSIVLTLLYCNFISSGWLSW